MDMFMSGAVSGLFAGIIIGFAVAACKKCYVKESQRIDEVIQAAAGLSNSPSEILNWPQLVVLD